MGNIRPIHPSTGQRWATKIAGQRRQTKQTSLNSTMVYKNCESKMAGINLSLRDKFKKVTLKHAFGTEASGPFLVWQLLTSVLYSGYFKNLLARSLG